MRGSRGAGVLLAGAAMMLSRAGRVSGEYQLVMEQTVFMETTTCEGVSCRREIIGANETLGVGALTDCSKKITYQHGDLNHALTAKHNTLFELLYSCRKHTSEGEEALMSSKECGIVTEPCLDASTNPELSEITYQIAFEFERQEYDVSVDVKLYFNYFGVDAPFFTYRTERVPHCLLHETCHRRCEPGERRFTAELYDNIGDGWNAGAINVFDHFRLESRSDLEAKAVEMMYPDDIAVTANSGRTSYKNTMLSGRARTVPLCLSDGEYLFSTEFQDPPPRPGRATGDYYHAEESFFIGERLFSESGWTFCGLSGELADYIHVRVADGVCTAIPGWGEAAAPSTTPIEGATISPIGITSDGDDAPNGNDDNDVGGKDNGKHNRNDAGTDKTRDAPQDGGNGETLTTIEIILVAAGALGLAGLSAVGGTYAQKKGWFAPRAAEVGPESVDGGGAPNPDVDEFTP